MLAVVKIPDDLQIVGYVSGAYGVQGWVRIKPYSADADALLQTKTWWLDKPDMHDVDVMQVKTHGGDVVASLMGVTGRDAAEALKGAAVKIARSHFPVLSDNEFYWVDLVGLNVVNLEGVALGQVMDLMDNGAHPILRIVGKISSEPESIPVETKKQAVREPEILIPFVDRFIKSVDQDTKTIVVEWGLDY
ncbi:ribosome maturation factor RimM [Herbaspirillum sp. RTI4]|uniref:ribosome maturation factor RimM n=1 Tax=Herbaspirillum sp. RTI4 TaxID=3048640 RepID=UPI002AB43608|nr:ribosome maturation factor RimM [Herbaspirillum sp. RTI4]MDY7579835.1 ribosome maturation factor RimM [Herbaspirillum sp. RTI4]MEA9981922.1 ribosome maturation factor RimM [Herbaspirillum sp. RTI4]